MTKLCPLALWSSGYLKKLPIHRWIKYDVISVTLDGKKTLIRERLIRAGDKDLSRALKDKWKLVREVTRSCVHVTETRTLFQHPLPGPNSQPLTFCSSNTLDMLTNSSWGSEWHERGPGSQWIFENILNSLLDSLTTTNLTMSEKILEKLTLHSRKAGLWQTCSTDSHVSHFLGKCPLTLGQNAFPVLCWTTPQPQVQTAAL